MKYMVVIEKGERGYGAHVPDLPGCMAAGETRDEVVALIKEAIEFHIEGLKEYGEPVPHPSSVVEYIEVNAGGPDGFPSGSEGQEGVI